MAALTLADVQELLDQSHGPGSIVSCYADFTVAEGFKSHWRGHLKTAAHEIRETLAGDHQARLEFERSMQVVHSALEETPEPDTRGRAVFSSCQRGFLRSFTLHAPVENRLVIHVMPYVVPLLEVLLEEHEYLVVLADTHRGQLLGAASNGGVVTTLATFDDYMPPRPHTSHREDYILHSLKDVLQGIEKAWAERPFHGIVLLGEHEVIEIVRKRLPPRLAGRVVHEAAYNWRDIRANADAEVRAQVMALRCQEEARIQAELHGRLAERRAIAVGPKAVVEALQTGKVGPRGHGRLVLGQDPKEAVARCTACRFLSLDSPAACPRCQAACVDGNLWEELLFFAVRHDISVAFLKADETLSREGGAAALLPRAPSD